MDPVAVAVETASHCAQKRLHFQPHAMLEQRPHPRIKNGRVPRRSRRLADVRIRCLPFLVSRQQRTQPRRKVVDDGTGALVEAEPDQALRASRRRRRCNGTPAAGNASRPPRPHASATPHWESPGHDRAGVRDRRCAAADPGSTNCRSAKRPLSPKKRAEPVEPIALEPNGRRSCRKLGPETEPYQFRPAHGRSQRFGRQNFQTIRLYRLDGGILPSPALRQTKSRSAPMLASLMPFQNRRRTAPHPAPWRLHAANAPHRAGGPADRRLSARPASVASSHASSTSSGKSRSSPSPPRMAPTSPTTSSNMEIFSSSSASS